MNKEKTCFLIAPIGEESSSERKKLDGLLKILEKVFEETNYKIIAANQISESGSIPSQIIRLLNDADLVIANLSGLNGNVMYELALRHVFGKHVVIVAEEGTKTPFDIYTERIIFFNDSFYGYNDFLEQLKISVEHCNTRDEVDNPVTRANIKFNETETERQERAMEFRIIAMEEIQKNNFIYPVNQVIDSYPVRLDSGAEVKIPLLIETATELLLPYITVTSSRGTFQRSFMNLQSAVGSVIRIRKLLSVAKSKNIRGVMIINSDFMQEVTMHKNIEIIHFNMKDKSFIPNNKNSETTVVKMA